MGKIILKVSIILIAVLLLCEGVSAQKRISINIPTAESEADYVWRTIKDINFFEKNNYQVSFPKGSLIEDLKVKSRHNKLSNVDYENLKTFMHDKVYKKSDYMKGYKNIQSKQMLINKIISEFPKYKWGFKEAEIYQINLTLYGPGGSYNPKNSSVLIYTTKNGEFKQYKNPANTIIHEIVHIGIQESIVNKYKVSHRLKERIVDLFVSLNFKKFLPDYKIQNMGEKRIDPFLKEKSDLYSLDKSVARICCK